MSRSDLTIEVEVTDLLDTLRTNRAKHLKAYEAAKVGYRKLLKQELYDKIAVLDGKKFRARPANQHLGHIINRRPENYLAEYDEVIGMLEWTQDATIRLDSTQYQQYIKNEWNWSNSFTTANVAYAAASRR